MRLSEALKILKQANFNIPPPLEDYIKGEEFKQQGIVEVWKCKCGWIYKSHTHLQDLDHGCGKSAKRIWKST